MWVVRGAGRRSLSRLQPPLHPPVLSFTTQRPNPGPMLITLIPARAPPLASPPVTQPYWQFRFGGDLRRWEDTHLSPSQGLGWGLQSAAL